MVFSGFDTVYFSGLIHFVLLFRVTVFSFKWFFFGLVC